MHCASCAMTIQKAVSKMIGIKSAEVNFGTETLSAEYDETKIGHKDIEKAVKEVGYKLEIPEQEKPSMTMSHEEHLLEKDKTEREKELNSLKKKVIIGSIFSVIIFLGSFPEWFQFIPKILQNYFVLLILTAPVQFWVGSKFYRGLVVLFKYRTADMNTLISIGTLAAYFYSSAVTFFPGFFEKGGIMPKVYFDTSAIIITLILLGKYLEMLARGRASEAIKKLMKLGAKTARIIINGQEKEIPIEEVAAGQEILVKPGEKIPVDGEVLDSKSSVDESLVTGESMPVSKERGSKVIGSTINLSGMLRFKATKVGKDTLLSQIIKMVEQAQASKAPIQRLADLVSGYFVPAVIGIAALTFALWFFLGPTPALTFALVNFVAVLIIACPCALGLATPLAIMIGTGNAAQKGILIKDAESLEIANKIKAIILDKTGTLTQGKPDLTDIIVYGNFSEKEVLRLAASLERYSEHHLAKPIVEKAKRDNLELTEVKNFQAVSGKGVRGDLGIIGNRKLMEDSGISLVNIEKDIIKLEEEGKTAVILAVENRVVGILAVADTLKKEAREVIKSLREKGIEVWMITGDNERVARTIGQQLGIENIMAQVLPQDKAGKVKEIQKTGKFVAMVGDGINDAPALAQADLGIAMGEGTDIAMESAEITLMRGDLTLIPEIISLSKKTLRVIKQNLFWAFFYNSAFIPVAAGALYPFFGILLNPIFAAAAMAFSSLSVVLNSLRLKSA
ncbi:MAG: copper-translocating P-type ATPase [Candidatus Nealsonbacteria bacterium]|nr:copper-translocating P-type ATPase [Candidatus Nealsonbacteria bacterium]